MTIYELETVRHLSNSNGYRCYSVYYASLYDALDALAGWKSMFEERVTRATDREVFFNPAQDEKEDVYFVVRRINEVEVY